MATTQASSDQYVEFDEFVDYHLARTRSSIKLTDVLTAVVGIAVLVVGYLLAFTLLDHWVVDGGFGFAARATMLALIVVVAVGWVAIKVILPWLKPVNRLYAAGVIEGAEPKLKHSLFNLVDLGRANKTIKPEVRRAMEKQAAVRLSEVDVDNSVDRRILMRFAYALLFLVVVSCLYAVFSPKKISFLRTLTLADAGVATRTEILSVTPGDVEVIAGDQVEVTVDLKGQVPESVRIYYSLEDRSVVDEPVEMREVEDGVRQFSGIINGTNGRGILQNMSYHIAAGDARSDDFRITVNRPPSALVEAITLTFPKYMETAEHRQSVGHIDAYEGARVKLTASANMPVKVARLEFFDDPEQKGEQISLVIDGTTLTTEWSLAVASDGTFLKHYRVYVENENGDTDPNPTTYNINIKRDKAPEVVLLDPARDVELPANGVLPFLLQAHDPDFKLRSIALRFQRVGVEFEQSESIYDGLTEGFHKAWAGQHEFRLTGRGFEAGDVVRFWLEARDNRPPLGNRATTLPLKIHIVAPVSSQEAEKRLEEDRKQQQEVLDEIREQQPDAAQGDAGDGDSDDVAQKPGEDQKADGDPQENGNENGEKGDKPGNQGAQQPGDKTEAGDSNRNPEDDSTGDGSNEEQRSDKARDDEALQKMIERMQDGKKQDDVGGNLKENPSQPESSDEAGDKSDSSNAEADPNGKKPDEDGKNESNPQPGENTAAGDGKAKSQPGDVSAGQKKNSEGAPDKEPTKSGEGDTAVNRDDPELNKTGDSSQGGESKPDDGDDSVQRRPGDGNETGEASAGDADAETNQAKHPDDLNRKPGEDPTMRDADGQKQDGKTPSKPEPGTNPDPEQQSADGAKPQDDSKNGEPQKANKPGDPGSKQESPSGKKPSKQSAKDGKSGSKSGDESGKQPGDPKAGESSKGGDSKDGESKGGESKGGESKGGESKGGESKGGESKGGESKGGESKGGESKGGESKGGESKGGESKGGESKGGESKGGESKGGESKGGESKGGESKGGESKGGESKGGESKGGESKGGESKGGESKGGESKGGESKGGESKGGESKGGESKGGESKGGESKGGESKGGESKGGESKGGESKGAGGKGASGKGAGSEGEGGGAGASSAPAGKSSPNGLGGGGGAGDAGDQANHPGSGDGSGTGDPGEGTPDDPNLTDAKKAANLVLDKLNKELKRGEIDEKLLKELGWDEKDLARFVERMKKQLGTQENEVSPKTEAQRKRFEEMLKSLDLEKSRSRRVGRSDRDRTMKGVNSRQIQAPPEYRDAFEAYKRSLSRKKK